MLQDVIILSQLFEGKMEISYVGNCQTTCINRRPISVTYISKDLLTEVKVHLKGCKFAEESIMTDE